MSSLSRPGRWFSSWFPSFSSSFLDMSMSFNDKDIKVLESELVGKDKNKGSEGHSYTHSTFTVQSSDGLKMHDVRSYRTMDGREIVKETRKLGDQIHEVTKITTGDSLEPKISANLEGQKLEEFNNKWNSYGSLVPAIEHFKERLSRGKDDEAESLINLINRLQSKIKQPESKL